MTLRFLSLGLVLSAAACGSTSDAGLPAAEGPAPTETGTPAASASPTAPATIGDAGAPPEAGPPASTPLPTSHRIAVGMLHSCAVRANGTVKCWGSGIMGSTGLGSPDSHGNFPGEMSPNLPDVDLGPGAKAVALAAGERHTCALLEGGLVKCWGTITPQVPSTGIGDEPGEMGATLAPLPFGTGRTVKLLASSAASRHACAILDDGAVKCWGNNALGQLGVGDAVSRTSAAAMGDALPAVDLGEKATHVATGQYHSCAALASGAVKCWGNDAERALGTSVASFTNPALGDQPGEMGAALPAVPLPAGFVAVEVAAGVAHSCARAVDGRVACWGRGSDQERGNCSSSVDPGPCLLDAPAATQLVTGERNTALVDGAGALRIVGRNSSGQVGQGTSAGALGSLVRLGPSYPLTDVGGPVLELAFGETHACALFAGDVVKCWGGNGSGQLGTEKATVVGDQPGEMGAALIPAKL